MSVYVRKCQAELDGGVGPYQGEEGSLVSDDNGESANTHTTASRTTEMSAAK